MCKFKYPFIGHREATGEMVLFSEEGKGINLNDLEKPLSSYNTDLFRDITKSRLINTWGEIESKEHLNFIKELCTNAGFTLTQPLQGRVFIIHTSKLEFAEHKIDIHPHLHSINKYTRIHLPNPPQEVCIEGKFGHSVGRDKDAKVYQRILYGIDGKKTITDVYRVLDAFPTESAEIDHAVKKLLCAGLRGTKSKTQDYEEAIRSIEAAIKLAQQKLLLI